MKKNRIKLIAASLLTAVSGATMVHAEPVLPLHMCNQEKFQDYPLRYDGKGCMPAIPLTSEPKGGTYTS